MSFHEILKQKLEEKTSLFTSDKIVSEAPLLTDSPLISWLWALGQKRHHTSFGGNHAQKSYTQWKIHEHNTEPPRGPHEEPETGHANETINASIEAEAEPFGLPISELSREQLLAFQRLEKWGAHWDHSHALQLKTIKAVYRNLARKLHPDLSGPEGLKGHIDFINMRRDIKILEGAVLAAASTDMENNHSSSSCAGTSAA